MESDSPSPEATRGVSLRIKLIAIFLIVVLSLSSIVFVAISFYLTANANATQVRAEAEERLKIAEEVEISIERESSAWRNVLLFGYEHEQYHEYLSEFYETERKTVSILRKLIEALDSETELSELALRLESEHRAKRTALREAFRRYNESESNPYRFASPDAEASVKETLEQLVQLAKAVRDRSFERIQTDLEKKEKTLSGFAVGAIVAFAFLIMWVVDRNVGQPAEKAVQLELELRLKQADLIEAKEKAEAANLAKREFLTVMSHELRTPLNPIVGFSHLMKEGEKDPERVRMLESIEHSGKHMLRIVEDILDYSRIEKGVLEVSKEAFNIHELFGNIVGSFQAQAKSRGNLLEFEPRLPQTGYQAVGEERMVVSDRKIWSQLILNLIANANKFTEKGSVTLGVGFQGSGDGRARFRIEVRDTGIGIAKADQERVFEMFTQVDASLTRSQHGMGLGLALCRKLVDAIGGKIGLVSEKGEGSLFWVEIPCETRG